MNGCADASLASIPGAAWAALAEGVAHARHPFHAPTLATVGPDGAEARTVVLRGVDARARTVSCHTDLRSGKVAQLRGDPRCSWLFYDRRAKLQLRLWATARIHAGDALARARWTAGAEHARQCYRPLAPGSPCTLDDLDVPAAVEPGGFEHFAVLTAVVGRFDWLCLRAAGHRRARFTWSDGTWHGHWIGA